MRYLIPLLFVLLGIGAFIASSDFVLNGANKKQQFHELNWNARAVLNELLNAALIDSTNVQQLINEKQQLRMLPDDPGKRKSVTDSLYLLQKKALLNIRDKIAVLNNAEVQQLALKHIRLDPFNMQELNAIGKDSLLLFQQPVSVIFFDSTLVSRQISKKIILKIKTYDSNLFLLKYPAFGYLMLSFIIQFILYTLLIPLLLYSICSPGGTEKVVFRWKIAYIIIIAVVCIIFYFSFLRNKNEADDMVRSALFMQSLPDIFNVINILGYLTASLCLAGMLFSLISAKNIMNEKVEADKIALLKRVDTNFKNCFFLAAMILTLAVVTSGQFYTALNTLDLVKVYNATIGYDYFRIEIIYLYGILHTFLLLLFYIPVQLQLNETKLYLTAGLPGGDEQLNNLAIKSLEPVSLMKKVLDILVASSPLIAAFAKSLLDILFA
jgi:hypothetical protein